MDKLPLLAVLLISVPEEIMVTALGLFLLGIKPKGRLLILMGILQGFISYFVRQLPLFFGAHIIIQAIFFALVITSVIRIPYGVSLVAMMIGITIYAIIESLFVPLLLIITNIPLDVILASTKLRILYFLPQGFAMLIIVLLIYYFDFKLFNYHSQANNKKWWLP